MRAAEPSLAVVGEGAESGKTSRILGFLIKSRSIGWRHLDPEGAMEADLWVLDLDDPDLIDHIDDTLSLADSEGKIVLGVSSASETLADVIGDRIKHLLFKPFTVSSLVEALEAAGRDLVGQAVDLPPDLTEDERAELSRLLREENTVPTAVAPHPEDPCLGEGERVGDLRIVSVLGRGSFGITYMAYDGALEMPVVLKEFFPEDVARRDGGNVLPREDEDVRFAASLDSFVAEGKVLAGFRHPNIARVIRSFEDRGTAYLVMDYEPGETLKEALAEPFPVDRALRVARAVLEALGVMHDAGMLHCDIKPGNIYLRTSGDPMLLDFGAVRTPGDTGCAQMLTPGYAACEQYVSTVDEVKDDLIEGPWTDVYAVGATIHRMVFGAAPVDAFKRYRVVINGASDPLGIPDTQGLELQILLEKMLALRPAERAQSAGEAIEMIDLVLG